MDEKNSSIIISSLSIPNDKNVIRLIHSSLREKKSPFHPTIRGFTPSKNDKNKLSVDYEDLTTVEESIARFGATYRYEKEVFKDPDLFDAYWLNINKVKVIAQNIVNDIYQDPVKSIPPIKGKPDNPSHSLIDFKPSIEHEPEYLSKIQEYARHNLIEADRKIVNKLVEEYRKQWD